MLDLAQAHVREVVPDADLTALAVSFYLIRAADRLVYDLETLHRPLGWTWPGFRIAFWLWLLGPLEQREIASLVSASRASISSAVNTLERDGFVRRRRRTDDLRQVQVTLSKSGRKVIGSAFKFQNKREQEWFSIFTRGERETLVRLLGRLLDHMPPPLTTGNSSKA
jgi:DNA-binding MarR family transcriptional regulator